MSKALSSLTKTSLLSEEMNNEKAVNISQNQWLKQTICSLEFALLTQMILCYFVTVFHIHVGYGMLREKLTREAGSVLWAEQPQMETGCFGPILTY